MYLLSSSRGNVYKHIHNTIFLTIAELFRSLCILGHYLAGAEDKVLQLLGQGEVAQPVLDALAASGKEQLQAAAAAASAASIDIEGELVRSCEQLSEALGPQLIENQKQLYAKWNKERDEELQR